jgi:hypothetical protein
MVRLLEFLTQKKTKRKAYHPKVESPWLLSGQIFGHGADPYTAES